MAKVLVLGSRMITIPLHDENLDLCPVCRGTGGSRNPETHEWEDCSYCFGDGLRSGA
jgi:hypothetical protein